MDGADEVSATKPRRTSVPEALKDGTPNICSHEAILSPRTDSYSVVEDLEGWTPWFRAVAR